MLALWVVTCSLLMSAPIFAQGTSTISGRILDQSDACDFLGLCVEVTSKAAYVVPTKHCGSSQDGALDPLWWTSSETWIRCPARRQTRWADEPGGSSQRSSRTARSRLVLDEGKTIGAVARELDLTASAGAQWVTHARAERTPGKSGFITGARGGRPDCAKKNRELRIERNLLQTVSALFARHQA